MTTQERPTDARPVVRPIFGLEFPPGVYELGPTQGGCALAHVDAQGRDRIVPAHRYVFVGETPGEDYRTQLCTGHAVRRWPQLADPAHADARP